MKHIKNIIIVILMILSIYQTNKIWDLTNLFIKPLISGSKTNPIETDYKKIFAYPFKIYKYSNYSSHYTEITYNDENSFEKFLSNIIKKSSFSSSRYFVENDLNNVSFVFEYKYLLNFSDFSKTLSTNSNHTEKDFAFDMIYFNNYTNERQVINFVNSRTNELNQFTLSKDDFLESDFLENLPNGMDYLASMITLKNSVNYFAPNIQGSNVIYNNVYKTNPYLSDNDLLLSNVQEKLKDLFKNQNTNIWSRQDNNRFVFSNDDVIIKYYENDIVEASYYNIQEKTTVSIDEAFAIAYEFVKEDKFITNDFYLSNYVYNDDKYIFYFDYIVNRFYVDYRESEDTTNHITVTVENGSITNYKKVVYNYESLNNHKKSIGTSLESLIHETKINPKEITNASLTFISRQDEIDLYWKIETNQNNINYYSVE